MDEPAGGASSATLDVIREDAPWWTSVVATRSECRCRSLAEGAALGELVRQGGEFSSVSEAVTKCVLDLGEHGQLLTGKFSQLDHTLDPHVAVLQLTFVVRFHQHLPNQAVAATRVRRWRWNRSPDDVAAALGLLVQALKSGKPIEAKPLGLLARPAGAGGGAQPSCRLDGGILLCAVAQDQGAPASGWRAGSRASMALVSAGASGRVAEGQPVTMRPSGAIRYL